MRAFVAVVAFVVGLASARPAHADGGAVALLPLDAEQRLELYGQPVASEIARALVAGGVDVVVVGPKMAVPERAKLIVDGTIQQAAKTAPIILTIRVRDARDGVVVATVPATAATLPDIDKAAAELSARVLPAVKERLTALAAPTPPPPGRDVPLRPPVPAAPPLRLLLVAMSASHPAAERL